MSDGLRIQINDIDSYQSTPSHLDQFQDVPKVPVIRIYGNLRGPGNLAYGVLVHIHNYYPYFYIDCPQSDFSKVTAEYLAEVKQYLENLITDAFKRRNDDEDEDLDLDEKSPSPRFIAAVHPCRGSPVYGYTVGYALVLKIEFFSPLYKSKLFRILSQGNTDFSQFAPKGRKVSPNIYEAHITYFTQFLADFNLYPCAWLELSECYFRSPIVQPNGIPLTPLKNFLSSYIANNNVLKSQAYPRLSRTLLEIDCQPTAILNRARLSERNVHNDFTEFKKSIPEDQIFLSSLKLTFDDLKYQCQIRDRPDTSQLLKESYYQVFDQIGRGGYSDWESRELNEKQLEYVRKLNKPQKYTNVDEYYDSTLRQKIPDSSYLTTFQQVVATIDINYYRENRLLNFRDDLLKWKSYEELFEERASSTVPNSPTLELRRPFSDFSTEPNTTNGDEKIASAAPHESDDEGPSLKRHSSDMQDEEHLGEMSVMPMEDLQIFQATQIQPTHAQSPETSSSGSFWTQSSSFLVRKPVNIWERVTPASLHKSKLSFTMAGSGLLDVDYADPSYSNVNDVHATPLIFGNRRIQVPHYGDEELQPASLTGTSPLLYETPSSEGVSSTGRQTTWQYAVCPPSKESIQHWLKVENEKEEYKRRKFRSQIEPAVTQTNDFKYSLQADKVVRNPSGFLNLTVMGMELHVNKPDGMQPDPKSDPIVFIIFRFDDSNEMYNGGNAITKILLSLPRIDDWLKSKTFKNISVLMNSEIEIFSSEKLLVEGFLKYVETYDPDILAGYEVNSSSWGYLCERFTEAYETSLMPRLSRVVSYGNGKFGDRWGYTHTSVLKINGRHIFNVWRLLRSELRLTSYSIENVCFHLLHKTTPKISLQQLSLWYGSGSASQISMVCEYYKHKMDLLMTLIDSQELVLRNVEQSRLVGIDFYSNYYRGSQFKVESILIRIAKPENTLLDSPSKTQVHNMKPLEIVPLIMEPDSNFYKSPLVVLDFQSLYPSIMIAYNYCYSTLLGKIEGFKQDKNCIGYKNHHTLPHGIIDILAKNDGINISPNGLVFASSKFRKSILSKMLQEILNMRINVKSVASTFSDDKELTKLYNSKQLALKLIANVTYGYTSASFSGRMPNSDIADAIVATGRELMKKSIDIIEASPYNCKVVYGDTDSLFVYFPGRTKEFAFKYGKILADEVTKVVPDPIKLKFEKVYHPCVLLAKKRYVGNCFEREMQIVPKFEAKGIETIRRDGIPAQSKMVGKSLRILFETKDLSKVKSYILKQFNKIFMNRVNVADFCFAKEVRHGTYKNEMYLPPGAIIAKKNIQKDARSEPQYRERIPYLVTRDATKERIKDRCVSPDEYVASYETDNPMELDYEYYITRVLIPPLERIFNLMGVNIQEWYRDMPKSTKSVAMKKHDVLKVSTHMRSRECVGCGNKLDEDRKYVCSQCRDSELDFVTNLALVSKDKEDNIQGYRKLCHECSLSNYSIPGNLFDTFCVNQDCRIYFAKTKSIKEDQQFSSNKAKILQELDTLQW